MRVLAQRKGRNYLLLVWPVGGLTDAGFGPRTFAVEGKPKSSRTTPDSSASDTKTESLGSRTIDGISATGTRTMTTIPAGTIGNGKDLVVTRESWYSTGLKLVIRSAQSDPRFGEATYSLTNIQRNGPDPALFEVPAGYTIDRRSCSPASTLNEGESRSTQRP